MSNVAPRSRRTGRRSAGTLLLYVVGQALVALVGIGIATGALREASTAGVVLGLFLLGVAVVSLLATVLELVHGRGAHGALTGTTPNGTPATVFPRAGWVTLVNAGFLLATGGCLVAGGVVAFAGAQRALAVVLLLLGAALLSLLVPLAAGRVPAGGLYLTPQGVLSVKDGTWWRVRWEEIAGVVPQEPLAVVTSDGATPERGRTAPSFWRSEIKASDGVLGVQTRYLSEDADTVAFVLLAYLERPDLRAQLGTEASANWEILRHGS